MLSQSSREWIDEAMAHNNAHDGPTLRVFDADWNLVTTARTHSERRKLWRDLTGRAVAL